jgi:hypothetical protein
MEGEAMTSVEEIERELRDLVVANVNDKPVTRGELSEAFKLVAPAGNWKMPIDKTVAADLDRAMITEAVIFFTGSVPTFEPVLNGYRVRADGYYRAIGP